MNRDGTNQIRLTNIPATDSWASLSMDGTKIVFTSNRNGGNFDIYVMSTNDTNLTRLTSHPSLDEVPSWGGL